jgi:hypothetical protein
MKKLMIPCLAVAALIGVNTAFAAEVTGEIKSVSVKKHDVLLDNGQRYYFSKDVDLSKSKKGDKVKITFEEKKMKKGTKNEASALAPVS